LFRAVTRANPESRTTNPFETPVVYFTNDEVRKFRGFEARSLSLFDERASDSLNLPLPDREGVLETNANPLRPDETAGVSFDRYPKKNRTGYIHVYTSRPARSRTSDNESQRSRAPAYTIVNRQRPRVGIPTPLQPTRLRRSTHHDTSLDFIHHSGD
jgi:hypothetical protein